MVPAVLSDTVGFIRDLPEELVNAFRATLEELYDANILIHVLDASDPAVFEQKKSVEAILADMELGDLPEILVLNKIDRISEEELEILVRETGGIAVSAIKGEGINELLYAIGKRLKVSHPHLVQSDFTERGLSPAGTVPVPSVEE